MNAQINGRTWTRKSVEAITTEVLTIVVSDDGSQGWASVRWVSAAGGERHPELYGAVELIHTQYDSEGTPESERREVIDATPVFA